MCKCMYKKDEMFRFVGDFHLGKGKGELGLRRNHLSVKETDKYEKVRLVIDANVCYPPSVTDPAIF